MTKAPTPTDMSKGQVTSQTTPQKSSIKQRLRTDLGRSVGVTKATQLVWLTGLRAHLPTNRNSGVIKSTHISLRYIMPTLAFLKLLNSLRFEFVLIFIICLLNE